jgi:hypothetical protein
MPDNQGENYYIQVSDSIKSIYELTTRVDERQQLLMNKVDGLEKKIDSMMVEYRDFEGRLRVLESKDGGTADITSVKDMLHEHDIRLKSLEISTQGQEGRWKGIFSFIVQLIWVITAAFLLYHFGIQAPAIP